MCIERNVVAHEFCILAHDMISFKVKHTLSHNCSESESDMYYASINKDYYAEAYRIGNTG